MLTPRLKLDLEAFQGPFDLLLHLIKELKVDINDIPMTEVTNQYLAYVESMKELELDVIGDYLVMAATLLEIKSRLLLPIEPDPELDEDYELEDPRDILVQQLLLYQQFQDVSNQLEFKEKEREKVYTRPSTNISHYQEFIPLEEGIHSVYDLAEAMTNALTKKIARQSREKEVQYDPVTIEEKMALIWDKVENLNKKKAVVLDEFIFRDTKAEIIATFMAMLELVRRRVISFKQETRDSTIEMYRAEGEYDFSEFN